VAKTREEAVASDEVQGTTDPMVSIAFVLGWRSGQAVRWPPPDDGDDAPGLNTEARWAVLSGQIDQAQLRLEPHVSSLPSFGPQRPPESEDVYQRVLAKLYIAHDSLGKACRLGYLLQAFCCGAATTAAALTEIKLLLVGLTTKLPDNAAHVVINSLTLWEDTIAQETADATRLRRQGVVWRAFLSGDTAPRDVLHLSDYVGTADEVIGRVQELGRRALRGRLKALAITVVVLIVVGIAVLIRFHADASGVTAGAASLLAAFGLTWKGIGQFFGHAVATAEQSLWDAQLDWTVAYRATIGPAPAGANRAKRRDQHVTRWMSWQKDWPNTEGDPEPSD
jgi:hypothetical protein